MSYIRELEKIYDEMEERNAKAIHENGLSYDPLLKEDEDSRRCLAAFCFKKFTFENPLFQQLIAELKQTFPNDIVYTVYENPKETQAVLHHTFMQFATFTEAERIPEYDAYCQQKDITSFIPSYEIKYDRMIAIPSGIVIVGTPSIDINKYRDAIRDEMTKDGFKPLEPYKNNICHSTLLRFAEKLEKGSKEEQAKKEKLFQIVEKYKRRLIAVLKADRFYVHSASWRMLPIETESTPRRLAQD